MENQIQSIIENVLAFKLNKTYRKGMSAGELYDCTRGIWRLNKKRIKGAEYAFALYKGKVIEVYEIDQWFNELNTEYKYRKPQSTPNRSRSEFIGRIAEKPIREKYIGKSITKRNRSFVQYYNF